MNNYFLKLKLIFLPFSLIVIVTTAAYTFLHWLLFIKTVIIPVDETILNIGAPMVFAIIPIIIWLRPRIKLLKFKKRGSGDPLSGYMFFAWMATIAPMAVAQTYLTSATGKLTNIANISQIDKFPATKYYKVKHFYIDKSLASFQTRFEASGKYNQNFDMYIYLAVPVYDTLHTTKTHHFEISSPKSAIDNSKALLVVNGRIVSKDELYKINPRSIRNVSVIKGAAAQAVYGDKAKNGAILIQIDPFYNGPDTLSAVRDNNANFTPSAWMGLRFEKTISNKLSSDEKEQAYKAFAKASEDDFNAKRMDEFVYLDRVNYSTDQKNYLKAIANNKNYPSLSGSAIILTSVNEPFEARNGHKLQWIFGSFAIGSAIFMLLLSFTPLRSDLDRPVKESDEKDSTWGELKAFCVPREGFYITPILIDLNLIVFIIMALAGLGFISFNGGDLLKWGANYRPAVIQGEYWRLLTSIFLHGGVMHVVMNMYGLICVGLFLEPLMGRTKYLLTYLITGILASIASVLWHPATVGVGASGAIFGVYGAFFALLTTRLFPSGMKKSFLISTSIFIGFNLLFGLTGGIDNAAHIGGLISGLILGYALYPSIKKKMDDHSQEAQLEEHVEEPDEHLVN